MRARRRRSRGAAPAFYVVALRPGEHGGGVPAFDVYGYFYPPARSVGDEPRARSRSRVDWSSGTVSATRAGREVGAPLGQPRAQRGTLLRQRDSA